MSEAFSNKERLANLKTQIIELFAKSAADIQGVLDRPAPENDEKNKGPKESVQPFAGGFIQIIDMSEDSELPRRQAKAIKDCFSPAFYMCANPKSLEENGSKLADGLISRWSKAQMLQVFPDIIDDSNPEIQADISDVLDSAEKILQSYKDANLPKPQAPRTLLEALTGGSQEVSPIEEDMIKLDKARNIMAIVTELSRPSF